MNAPITVHGFETSNNFKVRVALGYKQLPYTFRTIDPADRVEIVRLSGQHLTPVLQHGDVVLFDSGAILRYLDAAFLDTPRLYGTSHDEQWLIEDWEYFARTVLAGPMMTVVHAKIRGKPVDDATAAREADKYVAASAARAEQLGDGPWLVADALSAADIHAAAIVHRIRGAGLFAEGEAGTRLDGWLGRVMAFDAGPGA